MGDGDSALMSTEESRCLSNDGLRTDSPDGLRFESIDARRGEVGGLDDNERWEVEVEAGYFEGVTADIWLDGERARIGVEARPATGLLVFVLEGVRASDVREVECGVGGSGGLGIPFLDTVGISGRESRLRVGSVVVEGEADIGGGFDFVDRCREAFPLDPPGDAISDDEGLSISRG
jgi:hypothetical protein